MERLVILLRPTVLRMNVCAFSCCTDRYSCYYYYTTREYRNKLSTLVYFLSLSLSLSLSLFSRSSLSIKLKVSHDTAKIHYRFVSLVGAEGTKEISVCDACLPAETDPSSFLRLHTASPKVGRREHSLKTIEPLTDDVRAVESAVAAWTVA